MKQTVQPKTEQKAAAGQMRSRPAQQQAMAHNGQGAQLPGAVNASPQIETLALLKDGIQQSHRVRGLMGLAAQINQVPPAQLQKIAKSGHPDLQHISLTAQREERMKAGSGPDTLQAVWVDDPESYYYSWESPEDGVTWYAHKVSPDKMFFLTTRESSKKMYGHLENQWKARAEWVQLHGGDPLKRQNPAPVPLSQIKEEQARLLADFEGYVKKGSERYGRLKTAIGALPAKTAESRDEFFESEYENAQFGSRDKYDPEAPVNYKAVLKTQPWLNPKEKKGLYVNEFDLARGRITADQNYSDKDNEFYVNKETGQRESYNNSEVIYQQWKRAKKEIKNAQERLSVLRRAHVSGDGIPVVKAVWAWLHKNDKEFNPKNSYRFTKRDEGFFALLAAANCSAAIYLIADHGREMGIRDIDAIVLEHGDSIEIEFA